MPAGRKNSKGSGAHTKPSGKPGSSSGKAVPAATTVLLINEEDSNGCPPELLSGETANELEGLDDGKLSELSVEEAELSECELVYLLKWTTYFRCAHTRFSTRRLTRASIPWTTERGSQRHRTRKKEDS